MNFCIALGFAAVYLQALGYSNASLGVVLAAGNIISALLGPFISSLIDRYERVTASRLIPPALAIQLLFLGLLLLNPYKGLLTSAAYAGFIGFSSAVNSLILKQYADAVHYGCDINYGIARGFGSLGYVLTSFAIGAIVSAFSYRMIPVAGLLTCLMQYIAYLRIRPFIPDQSYNDTETASGSTLLQFAAENKRYCILLLGTALLFFSNNVVCNFYINVARNVGGDTGTMGFFNGFMACMEVPVMLLYTKLFGRFKCHTMLRISFIFFTVKAAAIAAASTIPQVTAALFFQAPSFAVYSSAIVDYADKMIPHKDSAKAQSLAFTMTIIGSILSSVIGGWLYDSLTVTQTLWIGCAVGAAGTVIATAGLQSDK